MNNTKQHGGKRIPGPGKQLGRKPNPPGTKGVLLKAYPLPDLRQLVIDEAAKTGLSESQIVIRALKSYFHKDD